MILTERLIDSHIRLAGRPCTTEFLMYMCRSSPGVDTKLRTIECWMNSCMSAVTTNATFLDSVLRVCQTIYLMLFSFDYLKNYARPRWHISFSSIGNREPHRVVHPAAAIYLQAPWSTTFPRKELREHYFTQESRRLLRGKVLSPFETTISIPKISLCRSWFPVITKWQTTMAFLLQPHPNEEFCDHHLREVHLADH